MKSLNDKEERFRDEYLISLSPYDAAIEAGYKETMAKTKAFCWVSDSKCPPHKRHLYLAIQRAKKKRAEESHIDAAWVLVEQERVYRRCMQDQAPVNEEGEAIGEYKFEHSGANKALENIGKHVNVQAFNEKHSLTGPDGGPIKVKQVGDKELARRLAFLIAKAAKK